MGQAAKYVMVALLIGGFVIYHTGPKTAEEKEKAADDRAYKSATYLCKPKENDIREIWNATKYNSPKGTTEAQIEAITEAEARKVESLCLDLNYHKPTPLPANLKELVK